MLCYKTAFYFYRKNMIRTGVYLDSNINREVLENLMFIPELNLIGVYSPEKIDLGGTQLLQYEYPESLIHDVDAVIAFAPYSKPYIVENIVKNFKHVLFEPTSEYKNENIYQLSKFVEEADVKVMAGLQHYYDNVFVSARPLIKFPRFIQSRFFKQFGNYQEDNSVLMDMILVDVDIILNIVKSEIKHIWANYSSLSKRDPDIINVNIEFMNGACAQLTAGQISTTNTHEINFYCDNYYVSVDFLNSKAWQVKKRDDSSEASLFQQNVGDLIIEPIPIRKNNSYSNEFSAFAKSIIYNKTPEINLDSLTRTFDTIAKINEKLKLNNR